MKDILKGGYLKNFDNCHVRFLAGANELEYGKVNQETYELALKNFDEYFEIFGITERFDESLVYLKRKLNWWPPFYANANVTKKKSSIKEFDEETYQLLNKYNRYDLMLYDHACKKFDAIVKSQGESFAKEVKRFQKLNTLQTPLRRVVRNVWKFLQRINRS
jgi:CRISPR/Cas system CMR-associated protein Cmr1 (group 7 of RAMP superfamily)